MDSFLYLVHLSKGGTQKAEHKKRNTKGGTQRRNTKGGIQRRNTKTTSNWNHATQIFFLISPNPSQPTTTTATIPTAEQQNQSKCSTKQTIHKTNGYNNSINSSSSTDPFHPQSCSHVSVFFLSFFFSPPLSTHAGNCFAAAEQNVDFLIDQFSLEKQGTKMCHHDTTHQTRK